MSKWAVIVGRFQGPKLHKGHLEFLEKVSAKYGNNIIVVLGVNPAKPDRKNPLGVPERMELLRWELHQDVIVTALSDHPSDVTWSKNLDKLIRTYVGMESVTLYTGREGFNTHYHGSFPVTVLKLENEEVNNTEIRGEISPTDYTSHHGYAFRAGVIYGVSKCSPVIQFAVDGAVLNTGDELLVGSKLEDGGLYRFPGGMVDTWDSNLERAVSREVEEETALRIPPFDWQYVGSFQVPDWRAKAHDHVYFSTLFMAYVDTVTAFIAKPQDDLDGVEFIPLDELVESDFVKEHRQMFNTLVAHVKEHNNGNL